MISSFKCENKNKYSKKLIMDSMVHDHDENELDMNIMRHIYENEDFLWTAYDQFRTNCEKNNSNICFRNLDFTRFALALSSISIGSNAKWHEIEKTQIEEYINFRKNFDNHVVFLGKDRRIPKTGSGEEKQADVKFGHLFRQD